MLACLSSGLYGCSEEVTELSIDVMTDGTNFALYFREVDRPDCTCNNGNFPDVGACEGNNDGIVCTCDPGPAHCLSRVTALRDGETVGAETVDVDHIWFGYVGFPADEQADELRIEGCGGEAKIALDYPYSTPTITEKVETEEAVLHLEWTTSPPAPYEMVTWGSLSSVSCLDEDDGQSTIELDPYERNFISVRTLALDEISTALGDARVWYGNWAKFSWPETD